MTAAADLLQADHDARLFRMALRAAADGAPVQDVIDCAEFARATGRDEIAARLAGLAALERGVGAAVRGGSSVDLAIGELRDMMALSPRLTAEDIRFPSADAAPRQQPTPAPSAVEDVTRRTEALLAAVPTLLAEGGLATALLALVDDVLALPPLPPNEHLATDLTTIASLLGLHRLRRFLIANRGLLRAEAEGAPLLDAAARLGPAALGPYFTNVPMVIRNARDVFALIDAAGPHPLRETIETWSVLLSTHLRSNQLVDLIDELGDRGMIRALGALLARAARAEGPHYPLDPVWRIRDACLDVGEWAMAADAQQLIALWRAHDANEWRILAEIRAQMDDAVGVEGALERAMLMCPDDPATIRRMAAWRAGAMPPILGGYGTPPGRGRLRRARVEAYRASA